MILNTVFLRTSALASLLLALVGVARGEEPAPTLGDLTKAFEAADHRQVVALAARVPADSPLRAKASYLAGESLLVLGPPSEAEAAFRSVLASRPQALPAQVGLGRALLAQAKVQEAEQVLLVAVGRDPKDAAAARALGETLLAAGKAKEGLERLEAAVKLAPKDPLTARALAEALLKQGDVAAAKQVGERLAKALPKHPMGDFLVGLALDRAGESAEAILAYERALAKDDGFLDAHKNLAILCHVNSDTYSDEERVKKAFAHYERYFALGGADERLRQMVETMKAYFAAAPGAPAR